MNIKVTRVLGLILSIVLVGQTHVYSGLALGTKILTASGPVLIEELGAGSTITGHRSSDNSFPEVTVETIHSNDAENIYVITTDKGMIYASGNQLFYEVIIGDFIKAEQLRAGNILQTKNLEACLCINVEHKKVLTKVYDITLQEPHLYFSSEAQILTHNFAPAFILTFPWVTKAIVAIAGFCIATACLYNEKPTGILSSLNKIEDIVKNDMCGWCSKYYNGKTKFAPENYMDNASIPYKQPAKGGVALNPNLCQNLVTYPLRYGSLYPIAFMTNTGGIACIILVPQFSHWGSDGTNYWNMIEFGKEIFPRVHPFVKEFIEAEDKMQLDLLRSSIKAWPSALITKLFKSKITAQEKRALRTQYGNLSQVIYGNTFGLEAVYNMGEKKLAPSLVLQTIKYGTKGILCNPEYTIYFDQKQNVAVLIEIKSKKIINVGYYSDGISSLSETNEEKKKGKEKDKDKKTEETSKDRTTDRDKEKSDEAIDKVLKGAKPGRETKGSTKQLEKPGGFDEALDDFEKMGLTGIKDVSSGDKMVKVGKLPDGRTVNVRNKSEDSRPTLEIYDGKKSIKIRYGFK